MLSEEEYRNLVCLAEAKKKPLSVLIREAIEEACLREIVRERRQVALENLLALDAPVGDWPEMEQEIIRAQSET